MESRATRGVGSRGRRVAVAGGRRAVRAACEALECRRLMAVTNTIEGASSADNPFDPADPNGAVGPTQVVDAVNTELQVFTKTGTSRGSVQFSDFFAPLGTNSTTFMSDPHVVYDQFNGRFVVVILTLSDPGLTGGLTNDSHVLMAVSKTDSPTTDSGDWFMQDINTKVSIAPAGGGLATEGWLDYPGLAVSPDAIYLTGNMFPFSGLTSATNPETLQAGFLGSRLWIIPKTPLYSGGTSVLSQPQGYDPLFLTGVSLTASTLGVSNFTGASRLAPAQMYAQNGQYPTGLGTFLTFDDGIDAVTGHNLLGVIRVDNPLGVPTFTKSVIDVGFVSSKNFHGVPQPWDMNQFFLPGGTFAKVDSNDERVLSAVWRNGNLYATQEVVPYAGADADQITAHWYRINTGTATTVTGAALADQGNVGGEDIGVGVQTFFPAVAVNARGDMAIGFSASGPLSITNNQSTTPTTPPVYAGAYVTARLANDPAGTTRRAQVLAAGQALFLGAQGTFTDTSRWGDYSGVWVDTDDQSFWAFNMYAIDTNPTPPGGLPTLPETTDWGTRWGKFTALLVDLPAVGNFVWNDLNGNGVQDAGEPGIAGVIFRLVDAGGNIVDQTTSDATGYWVLQGPTTGQLQFGQSYRVVADLSAVDANGNPLLQGYTFAPPNQGSDDTKDSDFVQSTTNLFQATFDPTGTGFVINANPDFPQEAIENVGLGIFKPFAKILPVSQTVAEGGPGAIHQAQFTVNLTDGNGNPIKSPWISSAYYSTVAFSATPNVDFQGHTNDLVQIPAGVSISAPFTVTVFGDATPEADETFQVQLSEPSTVFAIENQSLPPGQTPTSLPLADTVTLRPADATATVTIIDDDFAVLTVDSGPTVVEPGPGNVAYALFTIRLTAPNPNTVPVTVSYTLRDLTATGGARGTVGADYDNTPGSVEFAPGQLTKTVRIPVFGDSIKEKKEQFQLVVSPVVSPVGAFSPGSTAQRTATATIIDLGSQKLTFKQGKSLSYTDVAGNRVTITLTGPGSGSVVVAAGGFGRQLALQGTTEKSVLTIRTDRGQALFSGIDISGGLLRLDAPTTNLAGDLTATDAVRDVRLNYVTGGNVDLGPTSSTNGLVTLTITHVADVNVTSGTAIKAFRLGSWVDTRTPDFLTAPAIGTINATGDFGPDVLLTDGDLQSLIVGGMLRGSNVTVTRDVNGQTLGTIGTVRAGSVSGGRIEAGARLNSMTVKNTFSNSSIIVPVIGQLDLGTVKNTTGDVMVAATAGHIDRVRWVFAKKAHVIKDVDNPGPRGLDRDLDQNPQIILQIT